MSPDDFIARWQGVTLIERASSQEHFIDLCRAANALTKAPARLLSCWGEAFPMPADRRMLDRP
jgi:hypothetical protein